MKLFLVVGILTELVVFVAMSQTRPRTLEEITVEQLRHVAATYNGELNEPNISTINRDRIVPNVRARGFENKLQQTTLHFGLVPYAAFFPNNGNDYNEQVVGAFAFGVEVGLRLAEQNK